MIGVLLEVMMVMMREVREDEFETDFDNDEGDNDADVGLDIEMKDEVNEGGYEYGDGDPGIINGFGGGSSEDGRFVFRAGDFEIASEEVFHGDGGDEDYDGRSGIIGRARLEDFLNRFNDDIDAGYNNDDGDEDGGEAFDSCAVDGEFVMVREPLADDDKKACYRIDETVDSVRCDGDRAGGEANDDVEKP